MKVFICLSLTGIDKDTASRHEDMYFERSDNFSFVSAGVTALFVMGGMNAIDPKTNGEKVYKKGGRNCTTPLSMI